MHVELCCAVLLSWELASEQLGYGAKCQSYVQVTMKWKKDPYFDSIEHIHKSTEQKRVVSLKNVIARNPNGCIPISDVSKKGLQFDLKIKVARLTQKAAKIDREEMSVLEDHKGDLRERLKKFIWMNKEKPVPLKIIQGMAWYLGLPDDYLQRFDDGAFEIYAIYSSSAILGSAVEIFSNQSIKWRRTSTI
ncbi:unnamed protein product [Linum tenue]|uniref:PORR domain-containing protein n=1 Tax=Linum tenue TaxID=586396 RepID=A0AAV0H8U2_9ROSI|nr:unnamed protein product [Linum tenue]